MPAPAAGTSAQRLAHEGRHRYLVVPYTTDPATIADPDAPTVAELTDAEVFDISRYCPKDWLSGDPTENYVPNDDVTELYDAQDVGSWAEQLTAEMYLQSPDNNAFDYFAYGATFWLVDLYDNANGADPVEGDLATVRLVRVHDPKPLPYTRNAKQRFRMGLAVLEAPSYKATVTTAV